MIEMNEANLSMRRKHPKYLPLILAVGTLFSTVAIATAQDQTGNGADNGLFNSLGGGSSNGSADDQSQGQGQNGQQSPQLNVNPRGIDLQNSRDQNPNQVRTNPLNEDAQGLRNLNALPPDPPTEFQRMVANSTGRMLQIYGAKLFRNAPTTFAPLDKVPVTPDYVVGPGDELLIQIWGQVTLNSRFTVDRTGNIYIPQVGTVRVVGLQFGQLQDYLKTQIGRVFRNFDLNVNMGQLRSIQVFVVGQARRPGSYTISSLSTLVNALFVTGGPNPQGSMRHIQLKRSGKVLTDFDLYDLLLHGDKSNDTQLLPGDVIYIPPVGAQVAVAGSINSPAIYELKSMTDSTIGDVLELAAGPTNTASRDKIRIERIDDHRMRSVIDLALDTVGRNQKLKDGDILELVAIIDRFKDGVTLRGNVANPGHYAWRSGMHVSELFPDKDALITRDYWIKRGRLGDPVLGYLPICPPNTSQNRDMGLSPNQGNNTVQNTGINGPNPPVRSYGLAGNDSPQDCIPETPNNGYSVSSEYSSGTDNVAGAAYGTNNTNGVNNYDRGNVSNSAAMNNYPLQSQGLNRQLPDDTSSEAGQGASRGSAAEAMVGRYPGQFPPRNDVALSAPDIDWSYAVIERQNKETLTTSLFSFNLGGLVLRHDSTQDLELQPGDVVTIFSKADIQVPQTEQTKLVHLEGEFISSGIYSVKPGETLRDLVQRAGGFTADAYLYGSEFMRESTRRVQQQRLNEYINEISLQATTNSVNSASRSISALDTAAAQAQATQSQSVISNLRQARASGRIVLGLHPDSDSVAQLPAIPLEDGDRFVIPHIPATVSVTGAVYNPNAFLFGLHSHLRDYLNQAGGPNRDADRKRAYIIRADGSVISKQQIAKLGKDKFGALLIYPGDTIVIPLNLNKGVALRNIVDISQIVGQFGIALAATNVIF
ncbi:SLBB domain-containing protein [Acidicapsa ligni]|uniref:SLBB domain-containing protein n=1 Tax=Acidicapsa ligni TaxID=542300 RepID=UPI0021E00590|nr:SLBB domain-containing protein [Acidicapsa ligni]